MWTIISFARTLTARELKRHGNEILGLAASLLDINLEGVPEETSDRIISGYYRLEEMLNISEDDDINEYVTHLMRGFNLSMTEIHAIRTILNDGTTTIEGMGNMKPEDLLHHIPSLYNGYGSDWSCMLDEIIDDANKFARRKVKTNKGVKNES